MKWLALISIVVLISACFFPWISVESKNVVVSGMNTSHTNFGKPGLLNIFLTILIAFFLLAGKVWSKRAAFFVAAFNIAWAVRNFIILSACSGGICPEKHTALFVFLIASIAILIFTLFAEINDV